MMMGEIAGIEKILQAIWQSLMHVLHGNGTPGQTWYHGGGAGSQATARRRMHRSGNPAAAEDQTSKLLQKRAAAAERDGSDEGFSTQLANMMAAVNNRKGIDSITAPPLCAP